MFSGGRTIKFYTCVDMAATAKVFVVVCHHFKLCGSVVVFTSGFYLKTPPVKLKCVTYDKRKSLYNDQRLISI